VTDITGFVASTYMRGVAGFGFVATSLLAQVDASVGGKNGVNLDGFKNMVGTFNQPDFVLCDQGMLDTLPERELRAGLAEIIKSGLIGDAELFGWFEGVDSFDAFLSNRELLHRSIVRSVELKARIVGQDEREMGERKLLNLGHTFGHAIEKILPGRYLHGEAVAIGLCMAARISNRLGLLSAVDVERVTAVVEAMGLPSAFLAVNEVSVEALLSAAASDKKHEADEIDFVLLAQPGKALRRRLALADLKDFL
jgi:3-dehydroquinate synthase